MQLLLDLFRFGYLIHVRINSFKYLYINQCHTTLKLTYMSQRIVIRKHALLQKNII